MARKRTNGAPDEAANAAPGPTPKRRQVNLDDDLFRKAGVIAAWQGVTLPDYINNKLRPIVEAELPVTLDAMNIRLPGQK